MTLTRRIVAAWTAASEWPLPEAVIASARLHVLDAVGVGLAASTLEQGEPYWKFSVSHVGPAVTLTGRRTSAADAALVNGGLIHSLEFDDTHTASIVHGSSVLAPVALSVAEECGQPFEAATRAYALGYETLIRIGLAAPGDFQKRGFQVTPVGGALVAALIAARLLGASELEQVHAMGIALSQASGVFEFLTNGSTVKSLHPGWAAHAGILAAKLAIGGMTGPATAFEGERGLFASFASNRPASDQFRELMADFGARWYLPDVAFKFVPCCHYLHPFVEAAGQIAADGVRAADIAELTLRIARGAAGIVCEPWPLKQSPPDGHAMRWSLPCVVAARLVDGKVDHGTFAAPPSEAVLALAQRCTWVPLEPDRFPEAFEAVIEGRLVDGRPVAKSIGDVYGNAVRPARREDVLKKFRANAGLCLLPGGVADLEAVVLGERQSLARFADGIAANRKRQKS